jgi:hypothetical protein
MQYGWLIFILNFNLPICSTTNFNLLKDSIFLNENYFDFCIQVSSGIIDPVAVNSYNAISQSENLGDPR